MLYQRRQPDLAIVLIFEERIRTTKLRATRNDSMTLNTPEDVSTSGKETLGRSHLEKRFSPEDLVEDICCSHGHF